VQCVVYALRARSSSRTHCSALRSGFNPDKEYIFKQNKIRSNKIIIRSTISRFIPFQQFQWFISHKFYTPFKIVQITKMCIWMIRLIYYPHLCLNYLDNLNIFVKKTGIKFYVWFLDSLKMIWVRRLLVFVFKLCRWAK